MSYGSIAFQGFGSGLNLRDKPDAVDPAECIDALNVFFTERGAIRQRDGFEEFSSLGGVTSMEPFYWSGQNQLLTGRPQGLVTLSSSGTSIGTADSNSGVWDFARAGAPGTETAFAGNGTGPLQRWDGVNWQAVGGPQARYITMMPVAQGNRMVACGFDDGATFVPDDSDTGQPLSSSRVHFSNPLEVVGALSWNGADWIELSPGDGEKIQAVITWREFTVVFKETRFFVFTGTSIDSTGNPVFDYRTVDAGVGLASPRAVASHRTGIYFMGREGVYRFTGGEPERLSENVAPIWLGGASTFYTGGTLNHSTITNCAMTIHEEKVYLSFATAGENNRTLVYDPITQWWSLYDLPAVCLTSFRIASVGELLFSTGSTIARHSSGHSTDAGATISSRWRSGWFDLAGYGGHQQSYADPNQKTIRESKLWGSGKVFYALGHDFAQDRGVATELDFSESASKWNTQKWNLGKWGQSEVLMPKMRRRAVRGTTFSTSLFNEIAGQPWSVHRMEHMIRSNRRPTVTAA